MRFFLLFLFSVSFATSGFAACNIVNGVAYGDCAGVSVNTGRTSFQVIDTYRTLSGISEGAQVLSGGSLVVSGTVQRVIVEQGGMNRPLFAGDPEVRMLGYGKEQMWKQIFTGGARACRADGVRTSG
ncbi:hypothetical protein, partial [Roseovarius dicentrarchi]|uniref:hypothetical protein n=1 Tax=Roseovarius dicentrarchi TaxID=2250573 RepID=UPI00193A2C14